MQISALKVLCPWEEQEGKLLPTENYCHLSCGIKMPSVGTGSQGIHGDVLPTNLSGVPVCLILLSFLLPTADAWFGEVPLYLPFKPGYSTCLCWCWAWLEAVLLLSAASIYYLLFLYFCFPHALWTYSFETPNMVITDHSPDQIWGLSSTLRRNVVMQKIEELALRRIFFKKRKKIKKKKKRSSGEMLFSFQLILSDKTLHNRF